MTIQGTIEGYPFTAELKGTAEKKFGKYKFTPLGNPTSLGTLSFPETLNFAGRMCLPTCTKLNISEQFGYYLLAAGDLSLIINKQIYATTTEKLAVLTTEGAHIVCNDGNSTIPACPQTSPCANTSIPCPPAPEVFEE